jgi:6,7-dimethyl-8-ribityllumazine synthase
MSRPLDQVRVIEGGLDASGAKFAIVVSRFNAFITERLLEGAVDTLIRLGAAPQAVTVVRTPGAWELPQTAARVLNTGEYDALIALGCLMRGDTVHFDLIASEVAKGLSALGAAGSMPVIFGVLTTESLEQAVHRAGAKAGNKGAEAAQAAVEQVRLYRALQPPLARAPSTSTSPRGRTRGRKRT